MTYQEFLKQKEKNHIATGFEIGQSELNPMLFDFQKHVVQIALRIGRFAIFAECGLGKTPMQLEWGYLDYSRTLNYRAGRDNNDEKHICPLQIDTIERILHLYSNEGETVFSPFGGIGSEGATALEMNRKSISIELKESYFLQNVANHKAAVAKKSQVTLF